MVTDSISFLDGQLTVSTSEILERVRPREDDIVVLSGTLVEGIGNRHSDLDVYVIGRSLPSLQEVGKRNFVGVENGVVCQYYDYLNTCGFGFDVEYYTFDLIREIISETIELYDYSIESTKIFRRTIDKTHDDALHKIHIGLCLMNAQQLSNIFPDRFWDKLCFLQFRNCVGGYPEFKDVMGAWGSKDYDTALFNSTSFLLEQSLGLINLSGNSNSKSKWIIQNLKRLPKEYLPLGRKITDWLWKDKRSEERKQDAILEAIDLVDEVFGSVATVLDDLKEVGFSTAQALELTEQELAREEFRDRQTLDEFEHRRRIFDQSGRSLKDFFLNCA